MKTKSIEFLKRLIETPSPSGFEFCAQKLLMEEMTTCADKLETDIHGNVIAIKNPENSPRIMLAGHIDEVAYMVQYIDDNGFLYLGRIGIPSLFVAAGQRITVHSRSGDVPGLIMRKNPSSQEECTDKYKLDDLWVDIGAGGKRDAEKRVSIGDPLTINTEFTFLGNSLILGRAFDDRIGSFIILETLRKLKNKKIKPAIYGVSTVQEETGSRGAVTSGYKINPDIAIAIDVINTSDHPGGDRKIAGELFMNKGPVLMRGCNINPALGEMLIQTAEDNNIPYQLTSSPGPTFTDANPLQLMRGGAATALVRIPTRYMHTPTELISLADVENAVKLLTAFISGFKTEVDFRPVK